MDRKWMPITAGVLELIHGVWGIFAGIILLDLIHWYQIILGIENIILSILMLSTGTLAIIGGITTLNRMKWGLAIAGAIASIIPTTPIMYIYWEHFDPSYFFKSADTLMGFACIPAIVAIVLVILSRKQFK